MLQKKKKKHFLNNAFSVLRFYMFVLFLLDFTFFTNILNFACIIGVCHALKVPTLRCEVF